MKDGLQRSREELSSLLFTFLDFFFCVCEVGSHSVAQVKLELTM